MSLHVFGNILTQHGTAANNRGESEGNTTTLQKLIWEGQVHSTVSAESIRFALRRRMMEEGEILNRSWDENTRTNKWEDPEFKSPDAFMDSDLLGYMSATAAKEENTKGSATVRRSVLEVTRAVSLTPWHGDVAFGVASIGATPSAAKKGSNPTPYSAEMHATRYQYGLAITPERLFERKRALAALRFLSSLGPVAGNHGRFLFDFSPESIVLRITQDPSPRLLYCFKMKNDMPSLGDLSKRVSAGDIIPRELYIGGAVTNSPEAGELKTAGACVLAGVKETVEVLIERLQAELGIGG